jgi:hypothetical protein
MAPLTYIPGNTINYVSRFIWRDRDGCSWMEPSNRLLRRGERESVVEFLEAFARLTITERDRVLQDIRAIREGSMPSSYQYMVAREGRVNG